MGHTCTFLRKFQIVSIKKRSGDAAKQNSQSIWKPEMEMEIISETASIES